LQEGRERASKYPFLERPMLGCELLSDEIAFLREYLQAQNPSKEQTQWSA
jgi:hypothetical protein